MLGAGRRRRIRQVDPCMRAVISHLSSVRRQGDSRLTPHGSPQLRASPHDPEAAGLRAAAAPRHHGCPNSRRNRRRSMTCVTSRTCCGRLAIWGGAPIWRPLGLEARVARWLGGPSPPLLADLLPPRVGIDHGRVTCAVIPCPHAGQCQTRCPRPAAVPRLQPSTRTGPRSCALRSCPRGWRQPAAGGCNRSTFQSLRAL